MTSAATFAPRKFNGPTSGAFQVDWKLVVAQAAAVRTTAVIEDGSRCAVRVAMLSRAALPRWRTTGYSR